MADQRAAKVELDSAEYARLLDVEEAARWHLANSACSGWPQGEALALALGRDPEAPRRAFRRLAALFDIEVPEDELERLMEGRTDA